MAEKQRPAAKRKFGDVEVAIWRNVGKSGAWYNATFVRSYQTKAGKKTSNSFNEDSLPELQSGVVYAIEWIAGRVEKEGRKEA